MASIVVPCDRHLGLQPQHQFMLCLTAVSGCLILAESWQNWTLLAWDTSHFDCCNVFTFGFSLLFYRLLFSLRSIVHTCYLGGVLGLVLTPVLTAAWGWPVVIAAAGGLGVTTAAVGWLAARRARAALEGDGPLPFETGIADSGAIPTAASGSGSSLDALFDSSVQAVGLIKPQSSTSLPAADPEGCLEGGRAPRMAVKAGRRTSTLLQVYKSIARHCPLP